MYIFTCLYFWSVLFGSFGLIGYKSNYIQIPRFCKIMSIRFIWYIPKPCHIVYFGSVRFGFTILNSPKVKKADVCRDMVRDICMCNRSWIRWMNRDEAVRAGSWWRRRRGLVLVQNHNSLGDTWFSSRCRDLTGSGVSSIDTNNVTIFAHYSKPLFHFFESLKPTEKVPTFFLSINYNS